MGNEVLAGSRAIAVGACVGDGEVADGTLVSVGLLVGTTVGVDVDAAVGTGVAGGGSVTLGAVVGVTDKAIAVSAAGT
jgi:hypothetical protein